MRYERPIWILNQRTLSDERPCFLHVQSPPFPPPETRYRRRSAALAARIKSENFSAVHCLRGRHPGERGEKPIIRFLDQLGTRSALATYPQSCTPLPPIHLDKSQNSPRLRPSQTGAKHRNSTFLRSTCARADVVPIHSIRFRCARGSGTMLERCFFATAARSRPPRLKERTFLHTAAIGTPPSATVRRKSYRTNFIWGPARKWGFDG